MSKSALFGVAALLLTMRRETTPQDVSLTDWIKKLDDVDKDVRLSAVAGLKSIGPDAFPGLEKALKDKDSEVRKFAALAVEGICLKVKKEELDLKVKTVVPALTDA